MHGQRVKCYSRIESRYLRAAAAAAAAAAASHSYTIHKAGRRVPRIVSRCRDIAESSFAFANLSRLAALFNPPPPSSLPQAQMEHHLMRGTQSLLSHLPRALPPFSRSCNTLITPSFFFSSGHRVTSREGNSSEFVAIDRHA